MGREPADSLMALLPPVGWADVATKHDLAELERRLELTIEAKLERGLKDLAVKFFLGMAAQTLAMTGLVFAAARLMG